MTRRGPTWWRAVWALALWPCLASCATTASDGAPHDPWVTAVQPTWHLGSCQGAALDGQPCVEEVPEGWVLVTPGPTVPGGARADDTVIFSPSARGLLLVQAHETTQAEWREVMRYNPSYFDRCGDDCPVEQVSWWDALFYLNRRSELEGLTPCYELSGCEGAMGAGCPGSHPFCERPHGCDSARLRPRCDGYRLPTQREWRWTRDTLAGHTLDPFEPGEAPWCGPSSRGATRPKIAPRGATLPLVDVVGNVWEWVWDATESDGRPIPLGEGGYRVHVGGAWSTSPAMCRADMRSRGKPHLRTQFIGLRPVRTAGLARAPVDDTIEVREPVPPSLSQVSPRPR